MAENDRPDVMIEQLVAGTGGDIYHKVTFRVRFTPEFWRKLYAGLAMQGLMPATAEGAVAMFRASGGKPVTEYLACMSHETANAMIAHEAKDKEDNGDD